MAEKSSPRDHGSSRERHHIVQILDPLTERIGH